MSFLNNKKDRNKFQQHPKVKIYYLKNDHQTNNENISNLKKKDLPTLSCLSSLIQNDNHDFIFNDKKENKNLCQNFYDDQPKQQINISKIDDLQLQKSTKKSNKKISQTEEVKPNNNKNTFQTEIDLKKYKKKNVQNFTVQLPTQTYHKRLIKTSQQEKFPSKNNEALSKDFLCNIVKEWNNFSQRQTHTSQNQKTKKWRLSVSSYRKNYQPEQIEQLKKNKTLMKEHFNLFLENQKNNRQQKKQKSMKSLQAVFNRDYSFRSISNVQTQQNQNPRMKSFQKDYSDQNSIHNQKEKGKSRKFSLGIKGEKQKYLRLMYGPQVKIIPRVFAQRSKIYNFDWTQLDRQVFNPRNK